MNYASTQYVTYEKSNGRVCTSGYCQNPQSLATELVGVLVGAQGTPNESYVEQGSVFLLPAKPSDFHVFDFDTKQWVANSVLAWNAAKKRRNTLLNNSDWIVARSTELGQAVPGDWQTYRQALRDVTTQVDPFNIVWPTMP